MAVRSSQKRGRKSKPRKSELWIPPLHPKQRAAFETVANECLYGGATRGGKSHFARVAFIVWCSYIPNFQADIFRLHFDDVIGENMEGRYSFPDLLAQWEKDGLVEITKTEIRFWNGSQISLEHCGSDKVMQKHQGIPRQARAFGEATQIPAERMRWLRSWCTVPVEMAEKMPEYLGDLYPDLTDEELMAFFPKIYYLSNPIGVSAGYFRRHFVNARPRMTVGVAPEEDGGYPRIYIPARVEDNPSENAEQTHRRVRGVGDNATADALLLEDWDAPVGDFFRDYDDIAHTCEDFTPPDHWFKFRTFDWGAAEPFVVIWWTVAQGETIFDKNGVETYFPPGSLISYREWNGCNPDNPEKGIGLSNEEIAAGIIERTPAHEEIALTLTDSLPFAYRGESRNNRKWRMADTFAECGVPLIRGNTDRAFGCAQVRSRLRGIGQEAGAIPTIYFARCCKAIREYLPAVQGDKNNTECYEESGEATHAADCVRYAAATDLSSVAQPKNPAKLEPEQWNREDERGIRLSVTPKKILTNIAAKGRKWDGRV